MYISRMPLGFIQRAGRCVVPGLPTVVFFAVGFATAAAATVTRMTFAAPLVLQLPFCFAVSGMVLFGTLLAFVPAARRVLLRIFRDVAVEVRLFRFIRRLANRWLGCSLAHAVMLISECQVW